MGSVRRHSGKGSLSTEQALLIVLLVLVAAAAVYFLGDAIAGIFSDSATTVASAPGDAAPIDTGGGGGLPAPNDAVAVASGGSFTVGLLADGTVVGVGDNTYGQLDVGTWTDIVAISAGFGHTVGLKSDGTVVAAGSDDYGQVAGVSGWTGIESVSAGVYNTFGIKSDGTVVAIGPDDYGEVSGTAAWSGVESIVAGDGYTAGLMSDGTVAVIGDDYGYGTLSASSWTGITEIAGGYYHLLGLKADGTVVAAGSNDYGESDTGSWAGITTIAASGMGHSVGIRSNGLLVATGSNNYGQCDLSLLYGAVSIAAGPYNTSAVMPDGTVVAVGRNNAGQTATAAISPSDGPVLTVAADGLTAYDISWVVGDSPSYNVYRDTSMPVDTSGAPLATLTMATLGLDPGDTAQYSTGPIFGEYYYAVTDAEGVVGPAAYFQADTPLAAATPIINDAWACIMANDFSSMQDRFSTNDPGYAGRAAFIDWLTDDTAGAYRSAITPLTMESLNDSRVIRFGTTDTYYAYIHVHWISGTIESSHTSTIPLYYDSVANQWYLTTRWYQAGFYNVTYPGVPEPTSYGSSNIPLF